MWALLFSRCSVSWYLCLFLCLFKALYELYFTPHMPHENGVRPLCSFSCPSRARKSLRTSLQNLHFNFASWCTVSMCTSLYLLLQSSFLHMSQTVSCVLSLLGSPDDWTLWFMLTWWFKVFREPKQASHLSHEYGLSPLWAFSCSSNTCTSLWITVQTLHLSLHFFFKGWRFLGL